MRDMRSERFLGLDALRGVAALAVLLLHAVMLDLVPGWRSRAYLAVDLFFMISGFVIAEAYGRRLTAENSFDWFVSRRLKRLLPLHILGLVLGLASLGAAVVLTGGVYDLSPPTVGQTVLIASAGAVGVPLAGVLGMAAPAFAANPPAWSLSAEFVGNLGYAAAAKRLGRPALTLSLIIGVVLLICSAAAWGDLDIGGGVRDSSGAVGRTLFGLTVGITLHQCCNSRPVRAGGTDPRLLAAGLGLVLVWPKALGSGLLDAPVAMGVLPAIVWAAARSQVRPPRAFLYLGRISYALYAIHFPILFAASTVLSVLGLTGGARLAWGAAAVLAAIAAAAAADRWFDEPLRRWVSAEKDFRARSAAPSPRSAAPSVRR